MRLLLLAGSGEARRIAQALRGRDVVASLAGGTRTPADLGLPTRVGGFGGDDGFRQYLRDAAIGAVLDATHPFAARISARTARICDESSIPYAQVLRAEWRPGPGDRWTVIDCEEDAADIVPPGASVFLGTGPQGAHRFAGLRGPVICRRIDPPETPFPFPGGAWRVGRPPFSVEDEVALFRDLGIDWLVVKNSGGDGSRSKLDAARILGIPVLLIRRPPQPDALRFDTEARAIAWVEGLWSDAS